MDSTRFGLNDPDSGSFTVNEPPPEMIRSTNEYMIEEEIGSGGTSTVYLALDMELQRKVAIKLLNPGLIDRGDVVQRFVNEAFVMSALQHPGIAHVYECGFTPGGRPFTVMKLIEGLTFSSLLKKRANASIKVSALMKIFRDVCDAMAYTHAQDVLHLDLKPANIMVGAYGECRIMDWGLARASSTVYKEQDGDTSSAIPAKGVHGTPMYMAPEQARVEMVDKRTDVFGLGAILCKILTGYPPYNGLTQDEILKKVSVANLSFGFDNLDECEQDPKYIELARHCLQANPEDRPDDAIDVAKRVSKMVG